MRSLPILLLTAALATPAFASSDAAWVAFRAQVETACAALAPTPGTVTVEVNPFGSDTFGAAIVTVATEAGTDRMICIMDKASGRAELTGPFAAPAP